MVRGVVFTRDFASQHNLKGEPVRVFLARCAAAAREMIYSRDGEGPRERRGGCKGVVRGL